ncbi:MAG: polyphenol oxidase family protein [Candidatus Hydrogenedentes bacterium]|nr:polyphenol oxidase family protein [Candidatus Hydrogenedentota bacterium]
MVRFHELERSGASLALMTDVSDGDCGPRSGATTRERICAACGIDGDSLVCGNQVHGVEIAVAGESDRGRGVRPDRPAFPATDALVTNVRGLPLAIFVADCVPVYIVEPKTGCIALVHAGREGTLRGIAGLAVRLLQEMYGATPGDIHALLGPSAGPCCYEVDEPRAKAFASAGWNVRGRYLDLWDANAIQLADAGIPRGVKINRTQFKLNTDFLSSNIRR